MRLTETQKNIITAEMRRVFGPNAQIWLFGSRVDDNIKGGDIDLYIETEGTAAECLEREMKFYASLQRLLGEQRIDIVVHRHGAPMRAIDQEARRTGVLL